MCRRGSARDGCGYRPWRRLARNWADCISPATRSHLATKSLDPVDDRLLTGRLARPIVPERARSTRRLDRGRIDLQARGQQQRVAEDERLLPRPADLVGGWTFLGRRRRAPCGYRMCANRLVYRYAALECRSGIDRAPSLTLSRSPTLTPRRSLSPAASSSTARACLRRAQRHGRSRGATPTTRISRSTNTASIGKRMKKVWMAGAGFSNRPSSGSRPVRPSSPFRRATGVAASAQRSHNGVPSSRATVTWPATPRKCVAAAARLPRIEV